MSSSTTCTTNKPGRYSRKSALASEPAWSHYQQGVFDWMQYGKGNALVGAVWGSGKTTLLTGCANRVGVDESAAILAFNVHIAEALLSRVTADGRSAIPTSRIKITTANAMGHALLNRYFEGAPIEVDEGKYRKIAKKLVGQLSLSGDCVKAFGYDEKQARHLLRRHLSSLLSLCQSTLLDPTPENLQWIRSYYAIEDCPHGSCVDALAPIALAEGEVMAKDKRVINFGDQLWLLHRWGLPAFQKKWVFVDEVQDANPAQLSLYQKMIGAEGRALFVGDQRQSIMGFSGSDPEMWGRVKRDLNAEELPLSVCYRCPTSHLDLARFIVPTVEPGKDEKGQISVIYPADIKDVIGNGDLVLCRFTAPLIQLCLRLLIHGGQLAKVRGRDIGASIVALARDVCRGQSWSSFLVLLDQHCGPRITALIEDGNDQAADSLKDKSDALKACHQFFGKECRNLKQFCDRIYDLFSDEQSPVMLSTIHRAKGDEADRVFLLGCNSLPYLKKCKQNWQAEQEWNLLGVALTRAKESLFLVPLAGKDEKIDELVRFPLGGLPIEVTPLDSEPERPIDEDWPFKLDAWVERTDKPHWDGSGRMLAGRVLRGWFDEARKLYYFTFALTDEQGGVRHEVDGGGKSHVAAIHCGYENQLRLVGSEVIEFPSEREAA